MELNELERKIDNIDMLRYVWIRQRRETCQMITDTIRTILNEQEDKRIVFSEDNQFKFACLDYLGCTNIIATGLYLDSNNIIHIGHLDEYVTCEFSLKKLTECDMKNTLDAIFEELKNKQL